MTRRTIEHESELRDVIGSPNTLVESKIADRLNDLTRQFIEQSPFVCVATASPDGGLDVSPRGDPAGFVRGLVEDVRNATGTERIATLRKELQDSMDRNAQVFRTEETLDEVTHVIADLRDRFKNISVQDKGKRLNTDLLEAIELGFLLDLAEVLVVSALARNESRGGHFREDYATRDDVNFMRHTMAYREQAEDGSTSIRLDYKPVIETRYKPMERKY